VTQQLVTGRVAERVVHFFEAVQVQQQKRDARALEARLLQGHVETLSE
jgi:hypothetical protein